MNLQELIDFHVAGAESCEAYAVTPGASEAKNKDIAKHYTKRAKWHRDAVELMKAGQQRLTVAEQLFRRVIACGELTRINHAELEADVCQWLGPVTPEEPVTFGSEYNNLSDEERSGMRVTARIQEVAALKPAAEQAKSCPNCKVCMGSPGFPENCLINGLKP